MMAQCTDSLGDTPKMSHMTQNEEENGVPTASAEQNTHPDPAACMSSTQVVDNLLSEQLSNLNGLHSQHGCSAGEGDFDHRINPLSDQGEPACAAGPHVLNKVDSAKGRSSHNIESMDLGHADCQRDDSVNTSLSLRDSAGSAMSMNSNQEDSGLEAIRPQSGRSGAASVLSDGSSYSWLREDSAMSRVSMSSDTSSGLEREEYYSARESLNSASSFESSQMSGHNSYRPGELTNQLVEGPLITLPPSELAVTPCYSSPGKDPSGAHINSNISSSNKLHPSTSETNSQISLKEGLVQNSDKTTSQTQVVQHENKENLSHHASQGTSASPSTSNTQQSTSSPVDPPTPTSAEAKPRVKKTPNDFIFGKVIGEGSYSTVYLAKEVSSQKEYAIKVCDKKHLIRERKTHFVMREKEVLMKLDHPFFIKLAYTFQDTERLYYVLTLARNGELLGYLHKLSVFDVPCTRFYSAEIILALEYLHSLGIIHRDLKPENILLSEDMHIKITDFGTSKILSLDSNGNAENAVEAKRKNSFVGTAEYVSPEVLNNQPANYGSDLWGLGCIVYQCLSGSLPFRSGNEYQTFQKIVKAEYDFPEGFHPDAKDLVSRLLVLDPYQRLGMAPPEGMRALKNHPFYEGIDWENLPQTTPPKLMPYLPATGTNPEFWGQEQRTGFDDQRLAEIITGQTDGSMSPELEELPIKVLSAAEDEDRAEKLRKQRLENQFHQFVEDNLIIKQGFVDKRKGLFARKRMLLLTEGPHLYYVDAHNKVLKGEIPWSKYLRPEAKNFKIFFVHTPNRTYYLESRQPDAQMWVKKIKEVWMKYFGKEEEEEKK